MMILLLLEGGLLIFEMLPLDGNPRPVLPTAPLPLDGGLIRLLSPAGGLTMPRPLLGVPFSPCTFSSSACFEPRSLFLPLGYFSGPITG